MAKEANIFGYAFCLGVTFSAVDSSYAVFPLTKGTKVAGLASLASYLLCHAFS